MADSDDDGSVIRKILLTVAPVVLGLGVWWITAAIVRSRAPFPGPIETFRRLVSLLAGEQLLGHRIYRHLMSSLGRWGIGFFAGAAGGIAAATCVGWSRTLERVLMPLVYVLQLIPGLAWIPIAILLFGIGNRATVFMITLTALAPVAINMVAGLKSASEEHLRVARMAGPSPREIFSASCFRAPFHI